ncbi:hypothetical protein Hamer_G024755, partial [Homarus americanus]
ALPAAALPAAAVGPTPSNLADVWVSGQHLPAGDTHIGRAVTPEGGDGVAARGSLPPSQDYSIAISYVFPIYSFQIPFKLPQ